MQRATLSALESVLQRLDAKLAAWQVQALYLGAQASTNLGLGPHHLLDRLFGDEPVLGDRVEDANEDIGVLMGLWNHLLEQKREGTLQLSDIDLSDPPTATELASLARRREDEVLWFVRG